MRTYTFTFVVGVISAACGLDCKEEIGDPSIIAKVLLEMRKWDNSYNKGDFDGMTTLYAANFSYMVDGHEKIQSKEDLKAFLSKELREGTGAKEHGECMYIHALSNDFAVLFIYFNHGTNIARSFNIYQKIDGNWKTLRELVGFKKLIGD